MHACTCELIKCLGFLRFELHLNFCGIKLDTYINRKKNKPDSCYHKPQALCNTKDEFSSFLRDRDTFLSRAIFMI